MNCAAIYLFKIIRVPPQMKHWAMGDFFKGFKFLNKKIKHVYFKYTYMYISKIGQ